MFNVVLVHPEIPPNTGNVIRLAANTGCALHLIEPLGFDMEDRLLRRAGLDYHEFAAVRRYPDWASFLLQSAAKPLRMFAMTTRAKRSLYELRFLAGDWLVFGCETSGLPTELRSQFDPDQLLRLPMLPKQRSLNLSNAVAVTVYEAWRQNNFAAAGLPGAGLAPGGSSAQG